MEPFDGLDAVVALPEIGVRLALPGIYDGLGFEPRRDPADAPPEDR